MSAIDTQCHCHNDFGLGVANTLAGLRAGARYFHVCVNAMGERAGMPDLAQMAVALKHLYGRDLGLDTRHLEELSELVANASRQPLPAWQPVVGTNVFAHESGIHVKGMLNDTSTFEPFPPEEVGNVRRYVIGKYSGRALLRNVLQENGFELDEAALGQTLAEVRTLAIRQSGPLPRRSSATSTAASSRPRAGGRPNERDHRRGHHRVPRGARQRRRGRPRHGPGRPGLPPGRELADGEQALRAARLRSGVRPGPGRDLL